MRKPIRILEVPLYLLTIAMASYELGATGTTIFLILVSILRLIVNTTTDSSVYKK
jgi:hypothetical protein|tara:strand:- start:198 stop:362 length:165 start_codon:yes stop_codon:yes gene_type:complete